MPFSSSSSSAVSTGDADACKAPNSATIGTNVFGQVPVAKLLYVNVLRTCLHKPIKFYSVVTPTGTRTSLEPLLFIADTTPFSSIVSMSRAARL